MVVGLSTCNELAALSPWHGPWQLGETPADLCDAEFKEKQEEKMGGFLFCNFISVQ